MQTEIIIYIFVFKFVQEVGYINCDTVLKNSCVNGYYIF